MKKIECLIILVFAFNINASAEEKMFTQFDKFSTEYAQLAELDPAKKFIQYPETLRLLGDITGQKILDIGCGSGTLTRMLARRQALVFGYDPAKREIELAKNEEEKEKLGIKYFPAMRLEKALYRNFDTVVSTMVLLYAADCAELRNIFEDASCALKGNGSFVSITFNPKYQSFGKVANNRRITETPDGKIRFEFFDEEGKIRMFSEASNFSAGDFETAARGVGFTKIEWVKLEVTAEGREAMGNEFWKAFDDDPAYIGLKVSK